MVKGHNHFKIGINDPELLHYRSGKSKSIFVNAQYLACNHLNMELSTQYAHYAS